MKQLFFAFALLLFLQSQSKAQSIPETGVCSHITRDVDDFTGEIQIHSPIISRSRLISASISKYIDKGKTSYYLSLEAYGNTVVVDGKGATILFTDGTKMFKPVEIDVDAKNYGFAYSAFITLTPNDLNTLSTKKINKFRLYIFDQELGDGFAENFKGYVSCIRNQK